MDPRPSSGAQVPPAEGLERCAHAQAPVARLTPAGNCREQIRRLHYPITVDELDYERAVDSFYEGLYRFAFSLAGNEDDACELAQETYARLLTKGGQVRDPAKIKSWLFTTLYRIFLGWKNRQARLPHQEISSVEHELPPVTPAMLDFLEDDAVRAALLGIKEHYRLPLTLFYLQDHSYQEIAGLLDIPIGTVMSRLSRGKEMLRATLAAKAIGERDGIIPVHRISHKKQA
jgi:RNA polymerase sigma-70 factor (ECF subfamily)